MKTFIFLFLLLPLTAFSQIQYELPLDIKILLSSNFGELRANHFHSGIDIKTFGKTGFQLKSIEKGYVSRIRISSNGYGRAIYIIHPTGHTSVYGHLENFSPRITKFIENQQRLLKQNEIDLYLSPDYFLIEKSEIIGFSGNSGRSGGPHLHFEIRNTKTEHPLNVLQFYPQIADKIKPIARNLYVYHFDKLETRKSPARKETYSLLKYSKHYSPKVKILPVSKFISFGIEAIDKMDGTPNIFGIYKLRLLVDNQLQMEIKFDSTSFLSTRGINALMDYEKYIINKRKIYTLYQSLNNPLCIYKKSINRGIIELNDNKVHSVEIRLTDYSGNESKTAFSIQRSKPLVQAKLSNVQFSEGKDFKNGELSVSIHENSLFFDENIKITKQNVKYSAWTNVYTVGKPNIPLKKHFSLSFKLEKTPISLLSKSYVIKINSQGRKSAIIGKINGNNLDVNSNSFGSFYVTIDTIPPRISPLTKIAQKNAVLYRYKITDYGCGINNYSVYLNNIWQIAYFDNKRKTLSILLDKSELKERVELKITVQDNLNNSANYIDIVN